MLSRGKGGLRGGAEDAEDAERESSIIDSRSPKSEHASPQSSIANRPSSIDAPSGLFRSSPFGRALGMYLPATVIFRLINFGRIVLLSWWMTRQQFGLFGIILLVFNVMAPVCSLGLNEAVTRYVPQHEARRSLWSFLKRSLGLLIVVTAVSAGLIIAFSSVLGEFFYAQVFADPAVREQFSAGAQHLARLSAVVIGLLVVYFYLLAVLKGLRMFAALAMMEVTHGALFLAASVVAILSGHLSARVLAGLYGVSLAIPILFFGVGLKRVTTRWTVQHEAAASDGLVAKLLRFSIWTMLAGGTWQFLVSYPALFLNKVHGHEAAGVFIAVRQIGQFILIGAVAVSTVVMTTVTKTWESQGREAAERQLSLAFRCTGLALLVFCAVIALGKDLVILMFKAEYAPGASILPLQLLFFLIGACLAFLPIHFQLIEKTRHIFWPWAVGVAANVLIAFWLTGPSLAAVKEQAVWRWLAPITSAVCATGFSDPQGLDSAAWCGVFAIGLALVMCVMLIRAERCRLDRGTHTVIVSVVLLAAKPWILVVGVVTLLALAWRTELVFTCEERRRMVTYIVAVWQRRLGGLGRA
ncbi:MAG: lipopolysaccharide biosynthesis protein [Phycisphaerae bacterium]|nr:lipopolysaccharide biosynthesis protein [Phycisphaerae bacterium]